MKLSKAEKELLKSVEAGEWRSVKNSAKEKERYLNYARATIRKDKRVNIRISERDLMHFQQKALDEGLPYQTFIGSVLHKYINGRLVEKTS